MLLAMANNPGPQMNVRFESKAQLERIRRAAKILGQKLNTFAIRNLEAAAEDVLQRERQASEPATLTA